MDAGNFPQLEASAEGGEVAELLREQLAISDVCLLNKCEAWRVLDVFFVFWFGGVIHLQFFGFVVSGCVFVLVLAMILFACWLAGSFFACSGHSVGRLVRTQSGVAKDQVAY